jgi:ECF transporter S component (folate family)
MKKARLTTEVIVITGFMTALSIVLSKLVSINISFLRIGFGFLPIAVLAIMYGPVIAAIGYGLADLIGAWLLPTGAFFPGFTVSAVLTGLIFGWVLYRREVTFVRALAASALVCLAVNLLLNTWWLTFIIGKGFKVLLVSRAVKEIVAIPVMSVMIVLIDRYVLRQVKKRSIN